MKRKCNPADTNHSCKTSSSTKDSLDPFLSLCEPGYSLSHMSVCGCVTCIRSFPMQKLEQMRYLCSCWTVLSLPTPRLFKSLWVHRYVCVRVCFGALTGSSFPVGKSCLTVPTSTTTHLLAFVSWPNWVEPRFYLVLSCGKIKSIGRYRRILLKLRFHGVDVFLQNLLFALNKFYLHGF